MPGNTVAQIISDLTQVIIKMLGRPAVQYQLLVIGLILVLAWIPSYLIDRWLRSRFPEHETEPTEPEPEEEEEALLEEEPVEPPPVPWQERVTAWLLSEVRVLSYPIGTLIMAYSCRSLFESWHWPAGLLSELIVLSWAFFIYRLILGILYETLDRQRVHYYRLRLLAPAFILLIILRIFALLTELSVLAEAHLFSNDENGLTLGVVVFVVVGFYFWLIFTQALQDIIQGIVTWRGQTDIGSFQASLIIMRYVLIGVGLLIVFQTLQLDTTTIAAITGGLSIGAGFALQDVLKNFVGGLILLFDGTIRPGDWVEISGSEGEIEKMSIRATTIRRLDNIRIIVPNQEWLVSQVTTYTHTGRRTMAKLNVGVSYNSNVQQVKQLLSDTLKRHPEILPEPEPFAVLLEFGDSSLNFFTGGWVAEATARIRVTNEIREMVWDAFAEHGIEIPFPQRDLHIRGGVVATPSENDYRHTNDQPK
ncbi:MAG: mechanosensitive ion channel [Anaerolineae bacterium]|nr:mechanosensitive ion channel [Anaerolineae bacterium]